MPTKRKQPPQLAPTTQPPRKQQHQFAETAQLIPETEYEEETETEEESEEEEQPQQQQQKPSNGTLNPSNDVVDDDDDDEPIESLLEPLGKNDIAKFLCEAAAAHPDVAKRIRRAADADPAHRKIFVHGLGWDATAETLAAAFRPYGEIEDCKAVADKATGKSKGYGFILFKTRRGARNALKEPQKKIGNRTAACQLACVGPVSASASAATAVAPGASDFTQRKIYVSNVAAELDMQKLLAFFSKFGEIEEGPLGLDKATGKPKGFCLFVFKNVEGAKKALEVPHKKFEGHILHCQRAIDGPKQQQRVGSVQGGSQNGGFAGSMAAPGHLMAPAGPPVGAAVPPVNIGQALALLSSGGAGLQLNGLLGMTSPTGVVGVNPAGIGGQGSVNPAGYGNQVGLQAAYGSQPQVGIGATGRSQLQHVGQYGGVSSYLGH